MLQTSVPSAKIWITQSNQTPHPIETACLSRWKSHAPCALEVVRAQAFEIHGDLLTRIWSMIRSDRQHQVHLISESDFWIHSADQISHELNAITRRGKAAHFVESCHRDNVPEHEIVRLEPLVAPWWILLNRTEFAADPPVDWLGPGGPRNDAANLAYTRGVEAGCFLANKVVFHEPQNPAPYFFRGAAHPWGTHFMWTRHWNESLSTPLFRGDKAYTVGTHLDGITRWLSNRGHKLEA